MPRVMSSTVHASGKSRRDGVMLLPFPLTPTLSLRERGDRILSLDHRERGGPAKAMETLLPLPEGEGCPSSVAVLRRVEGEGESRARRESLPRNSNPLRTQAT